MRKIAIVVFFMTVLVFGCYMICYICESLGLPSFVYYVFAGILGWKIGRCVRKIIDREIKCNNK